MENANAAADWIRSLMADVERVQWELENYIANTARERVGLLRRAEILEAGNGVVTSPSRKEERMDLRRVETLQAYLDDTAPEHAATLRELIEELGEEREAEREVGRVACEMFTVEHARVKKVEAELEATVEDLPAVRESVRWFARQMERRLAEPDDRGRWHDNRIGLLLERLSEGTNETVVETVIDECIDAANFAMMIADHARIAELEGKVTAKEDPGDEEGDRQ